MAPCRVDHSAVPGLLAGCRVALYRGLRLLERDVLILFPEGTSDDGNRLYMAANGNETSNSPKGLLILDVSQIQAREPDPQVFNGRGT